MVTKYNLVKYLKSSTCVGNIYLNFKLINHAHSYIALINIQSIKIQLQYRTEDSAMGENTVDY